MMRDSETKDRRGVVMRQRIVAMIAVAGLTLVGFAGVLAQKSMPPGESAFAS
jgi:hypothetical protein